jgi:hypothetical protein
MLDAVGRKKFTPCQGGDGEVEEDSGGGLSGVFVS